jgi:UDP-N-acetylglucosamine 2-epimerase
MKAHIPLSGKMKKDALAEIKLQVARERDKVTEQIVRRTLKLVLVELYDEFSFGNVRLNRIMKGVEDLTAKANEDEIFWEHIDRQLIDQLGLKFERDYTG